MTTLIAVSHEVFTQQVVDLGHRLGWRAVFWRPGRISDDPKTGKQRWRTAVGGDGKDHPDLNLFHPGQHRIIWAELKVGKDKLRPGQEAWLKFIDECGGESYEWRPEDLEGEILEVLSGGSTWRAERKGR